MMKRFLLPMLLGVTVVAGVSCQRSTEIEVSAVNTDGAKAIFMSHQTKSINQSINQSVRPLPEGYTPLWAEAVEYWQDGEVYTQVPLESQTTYTAVYPCAAGEDDHEGHVHDHSGVSVVQQLLVKSAGENSDCWIINIVPYQECRLTATEIANQFNPLSPPSAFSGFIAYHSLDGQVELLNNYINGEQQQSLVYDKEDKVGIYEVTKNARLYNEILESCMDECGKSSRLANVMSVDIPSSQCFFCGAESCSQVHVLILYCSVCRNLASWCVCLPEYSNGQMLERCSWCNLFKGYPITSLACKCVDWRNVALPNCSVCGAYNCYNSHKNNGYDRVCLACGGSELCSLRLYTGGRHVAHADIVREMFMPKVSFADLHSIQDGCRDTYHTDKEYEHALTYYFNDAEAQIDYVNLKNYFINKVLEFKATNNYLRLGEAIHPLLDCYLTVDERIEFSIPYYTYNRPVSLINEQYMQLHWQRAEQSTSVLLLYNFIVNLDNTVTPYQIGQLFEAWRTSHSSRVL